MGAPELAAALPLWLALADAALDTEAADERAWEADESAEDADETADDADSKGAEVAEEEEAMSY